VALVSSNSVVDFLREYRLVIGVLFGAALVSLSLGPYANFDTQVEFAAASSVVSHGLPFSSPGNLVNQPPLGFYLNGFFLRTFGLSYETGVAAVTLWGVGCVFLVYQIGKTFYNTRTGLVAAGVFALTPWQVVLARSFLIDVPCLFFSLLSLLVGVWAVQKASLRLTLVSGILFGFAFLTKFFAVFTLIPLAILFVKDPPKSLKLLFGQIGIFASPALFMYYLWYEEISRLGFFSFFGHNDFSNFTQSTPSFYFLLKFFSVNPGLLLLLAVGISIVLIISTRKYFRGSFFDIVCVATIVGTAGVNMFLVLSLGLLVPYVDPVKYDYQALPAFCLLAASLLEKTRFARPLHGDRSGRSRLPFLAGVIGVVLLAASIAANGLTLGSLASQDTVLFKVEGDVAFSFQNIGVPASSLQYALLSLGFLVVVMCMILALRQKSLGKPRLDIPA
jgi:4-amino-4-deoxy-L-arabinose transferase-like glycosyltransferase